MVTVEQLFLILMCMFLIILFIIVYGFYTLHKTLTFIAKMLTLKNNYQNEKTFQFRTNIKKKG